MVENLLENPIPTLHDLFSIAQHDVLFNRVMKMYQCGHLSLEQALMLLIRELHNSNQILKDDAIKTRMNSVVRFI